MQGLSQLKRRVARLTKTIETKSGVQTITDNIRFRHNNINIINCSFLRTVAGVDDMENSSGNRIGDKVNLINVQFKMMFELNEAFTDVTLRLMGVRSAKGDIPSVGTLWQGASNNKMLDTFNNERYSMLFQKHVRMKANPLAIVAAGTQFPGSGTYQGTQSIMSRATRIVSFSIPGSKFVRSGNLVYENQTVQPKFFDYHFIIYAYSNFATVDSGPIVYNVAHLNDCYIKMHYKDA